MINLLSHFPNGADPRPEQAKILSKIQDAIESNKKFIIIQAPTGVGKSHVAATLASFSRYPTSTFENYIKDCDLMSLCCCDGQKSSLDGDRGHGVAVLTITKQLQDQYGSLFEDANVLKGKQNYICEVDSEFSCDLAPCSLTSNLRCKCMKEQCCPLMNARYSALMGRFGVFNYSTYLTMPKHAKKRQFIICDEASELEDELVDHYTLKIDYTKLGLDELKVNKLVSTSTGDAYTWLTTFQGALNQKCSDFLKEISQGKKKKKLMIRQMERYRFYKCLYESVVNVVDSWQRVEYIVEITKDNACFTPLYVDALAKNLFDCGETVVLMSATLIDHELFAKTLGIKADEYVYVETDSPFATDKSPIYCLTKTKLNHRNIDAELPKLIDKALIICDSFKDAKGIIHTHTHKITDALKRKIGGKPRFLLREAGVTNENILQEHYLRDDGTVLISPSLGFGTDLKDDFGRFSIIMKTPYLSLGAERVKRLAKLNQKWYEMKTLVNLIQMCGRTTRNADDYSDTFILDGSAVDLIIANKNKIPSWFLRRLH